MSITADGFVWRRTCASTNDEAWLLAPDLRVRAVGADEQTAGRGRRGRTWLSPPGCGLYLSIIVRPGFGPEMGGALPIVAAVTVARLCAGYGRSPRLKWPNDVLLDGLKVAGILCEARVEPHRWTAVVGIGLNLRPPPDGLPPELRATALGVPDRAAEVARALLAGFEGELAALRPGSRQPLGEVQRRWEAFGPDQGTALRQGELSGRYAGLAPDGGLRVETDDGVRVVHAGEVEVLRATDH